MSDLVLRAASYPGDGWRPAQPVVDVPAPPSIERVAAGRHRAPGPHYRLRRRLNSRPVVTSAVVCTLLCTLVARPAYAEPTTVPDTGTRPLPAGPVIYPGSGSTNNGTNGQVPATVLGPFGSQITTEEIAVLALGEQVKQLEIDMQAADNRARAAETTLREATQKVADLRSAADSAAADAYRAAAGLGPLGEYADDLHKFSRLAPGLGGQPGGETAARDLLRAQQEEETARSQYQLARSVADTSRTKFQSQNATFLQRSAALTALKAQNATEYARTLAQQEAYEQSLGGPNLAANASVDGKQADPRAVQAMNYALSKRGSPYVWGDEGPSTFDCSGLAYWSYAQVGVRVPRVANAMYHGTAAVPATRSARGDLLLPGDLVFFGTNPSDWHSIYHMGIYIGEGRMVHAPTTGDVVRIAPVMWSRFFGATRIFPAVPKATTPPPQPTPSNTTSPPSSPSPTPSNSPSPSPSTSPSTSPSPSASPSPSSSPSPSPSPSTPANNAPSNPPSNPPSTAPSSAPAAASSRPATSSAASPTPSSSS